MEDHKANGVNIEEILSSTERLYVKLKTAPNQTLTREEVCEHLGEFRTHYYHVVTALERIKKVTKNIGGKGGIDVRTGSGIRPEILPCNREQLRKYFAKLRAVKDPADTVRQKIVETIRKQALKILEGCPQGIHYMELFNRLRGVLPPTFKSNTIHGTMCSLTDKEPENVFKLRKGVFCHTKYPNGTVVVEHLPLPDEPEIGVSTKGKNLRESDFYKPFADWLVEGLHECTKAKPVGGAIFAKKWGTPDVMGIRQQEPGAFIPLPTEIVSAEIKLNANELITAFGQACAYRLFSHKSYVVVPYMSHKEDLERVDALSRLFGIGLITFDPSDSNDPKFNIRARAAKNDPDMLYVNDCMKRLYEAGIRLY